MLKQLVNEARFQLQIKTEGPLLIKSGHATLIGPDMTPVLTYRNGSSEVYLPGTSLKGACRSHIEKVIRTLRSDQVVVCNPFAKEGAEQNCGLWFDARKKDQSLSNEVVYKDSCPACRLFGSTSFIGRVSIGDAYLQGNNNRNLTETRDGVGIDRLTGGAANRAKFDLEVVISNVTFTTDVLLRNFEIWQLGAMLLFIQDLTDGFIRLGSGKSRGLGAVSGSVTQVAIHHLGVTQGRSPEEVWGLGKFLGSSSAYGTLPTDSLLVSSLPQIETRGIRSGQLFSGDNLNNLQQVAIQAFAVRMQEWSAHKSGDV